MSYRQIKLKITPAQQKKAINGGAIRLPQSSIGCGDICMVHPMNYKKLTGAKGGVNLLLSPGEIMATANSHGMAGSGFFDDVWSGIKSAGKWLKDSGVGSALADVAQTVATPFVGEKGAQLGRDVFKGLTGVGMKGKKKRMISASGLYL